MASSLGAESNGLGAVAIDAFRGSKLRSTSLPSNVEYISSCGTCFSAETGEEGAATGVDGPEESMVLCAMDGSSG